MVLFRSHPRPRRERLQQLPPVLLLERDLAVEGTGLEPAVELVLDHAREEVRREGLELAGPALPGR